MTFLTSPDRNGVLFFWLSWLEYNLRSSHMSRMLVALLFVCTVACRSNENGRSKDAKLADAVDPKSIGGSAGRPKDSKASQDFNDGKHCAAIAYHNPKTGKSSNYQLTVEILQNEVVKLHWPNGGWLDQSHFCCATLDGEGHTSFTSDKGYNYDVTVLSTGECAN